MLIYPNEPNNYAKFCKPQEAVEEWAMCWGGLKSVIHFEDITSIENILEAWKEFLSGKRKKKDVQEFQLNLMANILDLQRDLANHTYKHGPYQAFNINDPKPRRIHKASVRDRLLHHATHRILYPFFDRVFIPDSFSCRLNKGTHKAISRFKNFAYRTSQNNTRTCWILKCDIKKFFENIDHGILLKILAKHIPDQNVLWLLSQIVGSFSSRAGIGLPLGNPTSQLFVNIYMNEFDQFVKHKLTAKYFIRYADDFVIMSNKRAELENLILPIDSFLKNQLKLRLHPDKVFIKTLASGLDFLGWVHFADHRILRTVTKRWMFKKLACNPGPEAVNSYVGLLKHGNTRKLIKIIS